eukprot:scaffold35439_cov62-Phaeocystis_antarctica.AAC.4
MQSGDGLDCDNSGFRRVRVPCRRRKRRPTLSAARSTRGCRCCAAPLAAPRARRPRRPHGSGRPAHGGAGRP